MNPLLRSSLNLISPGYSSIYQGRRGISNLSELVGYTEVKRFDHDESDSLISGLSKTLKKRHPDGACLRLDNKSVNQVAIEDIMLTEEDSTGQIVIASQEEVTVRYGERGIAASKNILPKDLLSKSFVIQPRSIGVLDIKTHVPFLIETHDPQKVVVLASCPLTQVPTYEENISRYSKTTVVELPQEAARILSLRLQQSIFEDKKNEYFYEEITSRVYQPTTHNRSSGTLMNFELEDASKAVGKTTESHYHPGERSLYIFTTNKSAGVALNFCGIHEDPNERPDCEVKLKFDKNSIAVLNFPPFTHHKFNGEFVCMSIHPREGNRLIEAVQSGTLPKGFLESATVFSSSKKNQEEWKLSLPPEDKGKFNGITR